jgi:hypothetical protein
MKSFAIAAILLAGPGVFLLPGASVAQSGANSSDSSATAKPLPSDLSGSSYKSRPIPRVAIIAPFASSVSSSGTTDPLEYRSGDRMPETDRALAANADPKIREAAALAGIEFDKGRWSVRQLVCSALPGHLFLIFEADNGPGDVSLFSAAIPRAGNGRVRIVPIERRGYSLFSPAPINALTVAAFNRIRSEEPENQSADWLATALCYAALAGAHPAISPAQKDPSGAKMPLAFPPTLEVGSSGDSTVRFVDGSTARQPTEWALTFSQKGRLLKVDRFATPNFAVTPIPAK